MLLCPSPLVAVLAQCLRKLLADPKVRVFFGSLIDGASFGRVDRNSLLLKTRKLKRCDDSLFSMLFPKVLGLALRGGNQLDERRRFSAVSESLAV